MKTKLIVTVDTEEEGLWSNSFKATDNTADNVHGVPAFQSICDNHQLAPVYLVNTPILNSKAAVEILRDISDSERAEIGTHIHPWNTPPEEHNITSERSYLCNLEASLQKQKLEHVTNDIENKFGQRPLSFRAGRYGLDIVGAKFLAELGYVVDSSVCPFMNYSVDGGPDFRHYPWRPYYIDEKFDVPAPTRTELLEVPVSFGFNWNNFEAAFRIDEMIGTSPLSTLRLRGILSRLQILKKIKFSPEKHHADDLRRLAEIFASLDAPAIVMMFHSSSLVPGHSPYVNNKGELTGFLQTIDSVVEYCLNTLDMEAATLTSFAKSFSKPNIASASFS